MKQKQRYLTKSRFKQALDCPTKLFYTKKIAYENTAESDTFLESLAQGGFQVEELARMNYPDGIAILGDDWDYHTLVTRTSLLLQQENTTIFEAAFITNGLFIRVDILLKKGDNIELIEVKAKSISKNHHESFINTRNNLDGGWTPYLYDVAFQKYVIQQCYPNWTIKTSLMLANKDAICTVEGLNQKFRITKNSNLRTGIIKPDNLKLEDLGASLLAKISIEDEIHLIFAQNPLDENRTFEEFIKYFQTNYENDSKIFTEIGKHCKSCEFHVEPTDEIKSGFHECWSEQLNISRIRIDRPKVYDVSNFRNSEKLIEQGKFFMDEILESDINPTPIIDKISSTERQWIQIEKVINNDPKPFFEIDGLKTEISSWIFPLNFIDFETSAVAIPFTKGRRPYEQLAFQFSHHTVYEDGRIEHTTEYLNTQVGIFPNFEFLRALKVALEANNGSIFRYHAHENTILNAIYKQLLDSDEEDKNELITFIKLISHNTGKSTETWTGERDMIDLWKVVKDYYYDPYTNGSNSIKAVLPAVLNSSRFLQSKYQNSLSKINLTSKNFKESHVFLKLENGKPISPYYLLPPLFDDWDMESLDSTITEIEGISDGGAALTAYGKLQFEEVTKNERQAIENGLLKYCELDTLAMVMIYEYFKEITN
ncbi:DUF2779 domain-containing protein [Yeosuana sp.]|uniref:DUF2779 domain-containing protein n=1 Tax=Yeosuana sp. TaxID=2529388 RepID=UPI004054B3A8